MLTIKTGGHTVKIKYNPFKVECDSDYIAELVGSLESIDAFDTDQLVTRHCKVKTSEEDAIFTILALQARGAQIDIIAMEESAADIPKDALA